MGHASDMAAKGRSFGPAAGVAAIGALSLGCVGLAILSSSRTMQLSLIAAAAAFLAVAVLSAIWRVLSASTRRRVTAALERVADDDPAPVILTDADRRVLYANAAARARYSVSAEGAMDDAFEGSLAGASGLFHRLQNRAGPGGHAREDVATTTGRLRVGLTFLDDGRAMWRLDPIQSQVQEPAEQAPVLTIGRSGAVLYMNGPARKLLGRRIKRLEEMLKDLPMRPGAVHLVDTVDGPRSFVLRCSDAGVGRQEIVLAPVEAEATVSEVASGGFSDLPVPLLRVRPDGRIRRANAEACKLFDVETADDRNIAEFMEGLGRPIADWLSEAAAGRGLHRSEFLRLSRADREIFVQITLSRVVEAGSAELVAVLNDATELKTLEAQFVQSQKMQAIGQLAGGVAHDFNNLLTAISGHCDLLLLRHDQGDSDYADLVQINQNANRAAGLVGQLLAFSRKQTLRPEVLDLRDSLSDLTHLLNRLVGEKVQLTLRHDPILPTIRGDRRQLEQVMMNLVVNARDAMPDGGEIVIETERLVLQDVMQRDRATVEPGTYVSVKVIDSGTGIAKDNLQKVFEPFFTTKRMGEGTGLGLSTVYGIVKQTGGFIFVDSVVGQGTCFTLLFPIFEASSVVETSKPAPVPRKLAQNGAGVILLVEDEAPVRTFAARALRLRGYTVLEAETAEDALATLDDPSVKVDVFVTDVVMPGMDGPTWVRKALVSRPDARVVFVSGYAEDAFGEGHEEVPNSVFLPKPFSLNDLAETVHRQLH